MGKRSRTDASNFESENSRKDPSTVSSASTSSETTSKFSHTDLEAIDYAMFNLAKNFETIVKLCPELTDENGFKETTKNLTGLTRTLLFEPRMRLARSIKVAYNNNRLPLVDQIISVNKSNASSNKGIASIPESFLIEFEDNPRNISIDRAQKKTKLIETESSEDENLDQNKSSKDSNKKIWPPSIPDISNKSLETQVFTHRSGVSRHYLSKKEALYVHNERLEFMGDVVLNFIAGLTVYNQFPDADEGDLSTLRSMLVCNDTIGEWSTMYGLDTRLETNIPVEALKKHEQGKKSKIIADVFEAYIAGLYLDPNRGPTVVNKWLSDLFKPTLKAASKERMALEPIQQNAKELLYIQIGSKSLAPLYVPVDTRNDIYTVECRMENEVIGVGTARNSKSAGVRAAMMALKNTTAIEKYSEKRRQTPKPKDHGDTRASNRNTFDFTVDQASPNNSSFDQPLHDGANSYLDRSTRSPSLSSTDRASPDSNNSPELSTLSNSYKDMLYSKIGSATIHPTYTTKSNGSLFISKVRMAEDILGEGKGSTRKNAEQNAAADALNNEKLLLKWTPMKK